MQIQNFPMVSIVTVMLCLIAMATFQYRKMANALRDRLEARHAERERIARELHDTFLQGIQGLILFFETVPDRIPNEDPYREKVVQALDRARNVIVDGRDRLQDLHARDYAASDLTIFFDAFGKELAEQWPARFRVMRHGVQRNIDPYICEEIYFIGREALLNAFQHAKAANIELEIAYGAKQLSLCIRDDGLGIDPEIARMGRKPGRWGLVGMRERAAGIHGRLMIGMQPGSGAEIQLVVPSGVAYAHPRRSRSTSLRHCESRG
ncbi:hypothetical protein GCM10007862_10910 [Dyella lipolytica]|uniref:Histidine kinase-, DNA gyrase B-, and HSP90-like ATPase n=1 Tax=Dyella lipolytica TaxID=1867835 RepID=A0ABW8IXD9_9GAMM|nr:histidine kinase [Dyella lipolytica]GLQ46040.1 hypothetical protein GCM10007862_10910 [Dyella lipolytica]